MPTLGLMVTGFLAKRPENAIDVLRIYVRACNVAEGVIESVQLDHRAMVLR